ncbi:MAG: flagellar hook-associated protein FlgK [Candidatus Delongbacteria bacterium]
MASLFGLLDTARSALITHQLALNVTGHNVANVDTPGYTRQRLELGARLGSEQRPTGIGAGVEPIGLQRLRMESFDRAYRREAGGLGESGQRSAQLGAVESLVAEPGDPGISDALDKFWSAWSDLGNEPAEESYRRTVLEAGHRVSARFNQLAGQFKAQREDLNTEVARVGGELNNLAVDLAELNGSIRAAELNGQVASDLRDRRDLLLDDLAGLVDMRAAEDEQGVFRVWVGGRALVDGTVASQLTTSQQAAEDGTVLTRLHWSDSGHEFEVASGELGGLLDVRDRVLPARLLELDQLADTLVAEVNRLHRAGTDLGGRAGREFFDPAGQGASGLALSNWVRDEPGRVVASADGGQGNGEQATAIAQLAETRLAALAGLSLGEAWGTLVSRVGAEAQRAEADYTAQQAFVSELDNRRQSISGVNLDEELTLMLQQEQAYSAAARVISTADSMIQELLQLV